MSMNLEGQSCPVCHAYLFDEDDVVYCPVCGAPHHRECYNRIGHCALEELHGTDRQYDILRRAAEEKAAATPAEPKNPAAHEQPDADRATGIIRCRMCGNEYDPAARACPKCGAPNVFSQGAFQGFDPLGGVPADYPLDENVTADDAKRFVLSNTQRYIPKFASLNRKNRISWNWLAFLLPSGWLLSRKMYKNGIVAGLLTVAVSLFTIPFYTQFYSSGLTETTGGYTQLINSIYSMLPDFDPAVIVLAAAGFFFQLLIRIVVALFGDYMYKSYTVTEIRRIKTDGESDAEDIDEGYRRFGGINLWAMLLGVLAVEYLPGIIQIFI